MSTSGSVDIAAQPGDEEPILAALADLQPATGTAKQVPTRDLDVVAVVCGANADMPPLFLDAGRASVGVLLVVDPGVETSLSAMGTAIVLRAANADHLLAAWDTVVA
jgi:hypothetical protein